MSYDPELYNYTAAEANQIFTALKEELDKSEVDTP